MSKHVLKGQGDTTVVLWCASWPRPGQTMVQLLRQGQQECFVTRLRLLKPWYVLTSRCCLMKWWSSPITKIISHTYTLTHIHTYTLQMCIYNITLHGLNYTKFGVNVNHTIELLNSVKTNYNNRFEPGHLSTFSLEAAEKAVWGRGAWRSWSESSVDMAEKSLGADSSGSSGELAAESPSQSTESFTLRFLRSSPPSVPPLTGWLSTASLEWSSVGSVLGSVILVGSVLAFSASVREKVIKVSRQVSTCGKSEPVRCAILLQRCAERHPSVIQVVPVSRFMLVNN